MRFRVGWESNSVKSTFTEGCPAGSMPVIDTQTPFAFGTVLCVCPNKQVADALCQLLNSAHQIAIKL